MPVPVASLSGRRGGRRPPSGPGLRRVEKLPPCDDPGGVLTSTNTTERHTSMLLHYPRVPLVASLVKLAPGP